MKLLALLFLLAISHSTRASVDQCSPKKFKNIDLNNRFCALRDQDSTGWCYAFAAAELLDYQRFKGSPHCEASQRTSAASLAINYVDRFQKDPYRKNLDQINPKTIDPDKDKLFLQGGLIMKAIVAAYKNGICSEKDFPSEDFSYVCKDCDLNRYINLLLIPKLQRTYNCKSLSPYILDKQFQSIEKIKDFLQQVNAASLVKEYENHRCNKRLSYEKPDNLTGYRLTSDGTFYQKSWSFWRQNLTYDEVNLKTSAAKKLMLQKIDKSLDNKQPVALAIYSTPLFKGEVKPTDDDPEGLGRHGVLLTGKQCINGKQYYLIRNSWGNTCSPYKSSAAELTNNCLEKIKIEYKREDLAILKNKLRQQKDHEIYQCKQKYTGELTAKEAKRDKLLSATHFSAKQGRTLKKLNHEINQLLNTLQNCQRKAHNRYARTYNKAINKFNNYIEQCKQSAEQNKNSYYNPGISCQNGIVRVLASELQKNLYGIDYFE